VIAELVARLVEFSRRHAAVVVASLLLTAVSMVPALNGKMGLVYFIGALMFGTAFVGYSAQLAFRRSNASARRLLLASIVYLPAMLILMMLESK
jgi:protoheme IX farnesyltransferase